MCIRDDTCICHSFKYLFFLANCSAVKNWLMLCFCLTDWKFHSICIFSNWQGFSFRASEEWEWQVHCSLSCFSKSQHWHRCVHIAPSLYVSVSPNSPINLISYRNLFMSWSWRVTCWSKSLILFFWFTFLPFWLSLIL